MGSIIGKVVLTGGPGAGKSTALARIAQELGDRGINTITINETASEIINSGIKPFRDKPGNEPINDPINIMDFQRLVLELQTAKEQILGRAPQCYGNDKKFVIVHDRGLIDNKAYIGQDAFNELLKEYGLNEEEMRKRYGIVIHLVTPADGKKEYYTLENNKARSESPEDACVRDKATMIAWSGHPELYIVDNAENFDDKINKVVEYILNFLGLPAHYKQQRRFIVDLERSDLSFINKEGCNRVEIEQTYLDDLIKHDGSERRLRKRTSNGESTYYYTEQIRRPNGLDEVIIQKPITVTEYATLMAICENKHTINKVRYSFIRDKQYFKLDIFEDGKLAILKVIPAEKDQEIKKPEELCVTKEVTNDPEFLSHALSQNDGFQHVKDLH